MLVEDCQEELTALIKENGAPSYLGAKIGPYTVIAVDELSTGRWTRWDLVVLRGPLGSLWGFELESGLTEYQEMEEPEDIEVFPVEAYATIGYRRAQ